MEDRAHVDRAEGDQPDAETLQAREERIAEPLRADPDRDPTRAVARDALLREELPIDAVFAGAIERDFGDQHFQQHLRRTDVEFVDSLLEQGKIRRRRANDERIGRLVGNDRRPAEESCLGLRALRRGPRGGHGSSSGKGYHLGALLQRLELTTAEPCQLARQAAPLQRLNALSRRRSRHGGSKHLPQRGRELRRAGVLERIYVDAESLLSSRSDVELAQQIEVACDVHAAVSDEHGVRARDDLDTGVFARDLLQEGGALFCSNELERHDLGHEPEWGRRGQVFSNPHGSRRRPVRLRRSEEHTSELQSRLHLVCRLLLEKKSSLRVWSYLTSWSARRSAGS